MARVELRPSGGYEYVVAVEDEYDPRLRRWRKKILQSFGNAQDPSSLRNAQQFVAAYNFGKELRNAGQPLSDEQLQDALKGLIAIGLLVLVVAALAKR
ncbi:MAG TPA: hypothetical protein VM681_11230 [Candidatus Thermoplasmatota archaeon]|nr:hypothetical protein [Candidatus Thermoplasmatota archaeon]